MKVLCSHSKNHCTLMEPKETFWTFHLGTAVRKVFFFTGNTRKFLHLRFCPLFWQTRGKFNRRTQDQSSCGLAWKSSSEICCRRLQMTLTVSLVFNMSASAAAVFLVLSFRSWSLIVFTFPLMTIKPWPVQRFVCLLLFFFQKDFWVRKRKKPHLYCFEGVAVHNTGQIISVVCLFDFWFLTF